MPKVMRSINYPSFKLYKIHLNKISISCIPLQMEARRLGKSVRHLLLCVSCELY